MEKCHITLVNFPSLILLSSMLLAGMSGSLVAQEKNAASADSSSAIVQGVKEYSKGNNVFSKLVRMILVQDENIVHTSPLDPDIKIFRQYTGKYIRDIKVEVLDVFGGSVERPKDTVRTWLEERGNAVHMETKEWIIRNLLIFASGDKFVPFLVNESERIIRESPSVYDVRILPQRIRNSTDSVDIIVYVQDIWSITGSVAYHQAAKSGAFRFGDLNFLGFGNEFKGGMTFDRALPRGWDWNASYSINNIQRTFLSSTLFYASEMNKEQYGFSLGRNFFSPTITWAGGIGQYWTNMRYPELINSSGGIKKARYNQQEYWLGYAFDFRKTDSTEEHQNRFNIAGRVTRTVYGERPEPDSINLFQDNTFYLGRIGYSQRTYSKDQFIFGLGVTEDIPLVKMAALLFGVEEGAHTNRPYYGITTYYSLYSEAFGYFFGGFQVGAFRSGRKWQNNNALMEFLFLSNLHSIGKWKWRHYIGNRYSYSVDPLRPQGVLNLTNEGGLRGFSDDLLRGSKRLGVNYEVDIFSPVKLAGFKLAVIPFVDVALISPATRSVFTSKLYQGYGVGFRFKNEHLVFPAFQFMFGYYPNLHEADGVHFALFHQSPTFYRFNTSQFSSPAIVTAE